MAAELSDARARYVEADRITDRKFDLRRDEKTRQLTGMFRLPRQKADHARTLEDIAKLEAKTGISALMAKGKLVDLKEQAEAQRMNIADAERKMNAYLDGIESERGEEKASNKTECDAGEQAIRDKYFGRQTQRGRVLRLAREHGLSRAARKEMIRVEPAFQPSPFIPGGWGRSTHEDRMRRAANTGVRMSWKALAESEARSAGKSWTPEKTDAANENQEVKQDFAQAATPTQAKQIDAEKKRWRYRGKSRGLARGRIPGED